jgi:hypothetical protein
MTLFAFYLSAVALSAPTIPEADLDKVVPGVPGCPTCAIDAVVPGVLGCPTCDLAAVVPSVPTCPDCSPVAIVPTSPICPECGVDDAADFTLVGAAMGKDGLWLEVANDGKKAAAVGLQLFMDDATLAAAKPIYLLAGEGTWLQVQVDELPISVSLDPNNLVKEQNEDNNDFWLK